MSDGNISVPSAAAATMTRTEIKDLLFLLREREKVLKATAKAKKLDLLARFEEELAAIYAWTDDAVWREIATTMREHERQANEVIAARATELGIPKRFMPRLHISWSNRGENVSKERRAELRKVAEACAQRLEQSAVATIDRQGIEIKTAILSPGLTSPAAQQLLQKLPPLDQLMPALAVADIEKSRDAMTCAEAKKLLGWRY